MRVRILIVAMVSAATASVAVRARSRPILFLAGAERDREDFAARTGLPTAMCLRSPTS